MHVPLNAEKLLTCVFNINLDDSVKLVNFHCDWSREKNKVNKDLIGHNLKCFNTTC